MVSGLRLRRRRRWRGRVGVCPPPPFPVPAATPGRQWRFGLRRALARQWCWRRLGVLSPGSRLCYDGAPSGVGGRSSGFVGCWIRPRRGGSCGGGGESGAWLWLPWPAVVARGEVVVMACWEWLLRVGAVEFRRLLRRRSGALVWPWWKMAGGSGALRRRRRSGAPVLRAAGHGRGSRPIWYSVLGSVRRGGQLLRLSKPDGDGASVVQGKQVAFLPPCQRGSGVAGAGRRVLEWWSAASSVYLYLYSTPFVLVMSMV